MRCVHVDAVPWQPFSTHRAGRIENKRLLSGREGAPDNYELSLVLTDGEYSTPRHRHNFDQVRLMLEGRFGFGERVQEEGSLGYFCEGVYYTQAAIGRSVTLLLQGGGASGHGFMSYAQLEAGQAELAEVGTFSRGVFTRERPDGGKINKDSYEAIWEHVNGRRIAYPVPRYDQPVIMNPDAFDWIDSGAGVRERAMGSFGERGFGLAHVRLDPGANWTGTPGTLVYVLDGEGRIAGTGAGASWRPGCAVATDDDTVAFRAEAAAHLFVIRLQRFDATARTVPARAA